MDTLIEPNYVPLPASIPTATFEAIRSLMFQKTGVTLPQERRELVYGRLTKRLTALKIRSFEEYFRIVTSRDGQLEFQEMVNALTTHTTSFYREPHHFEFLRSRIFPEWEKTKPTRPFRIWSAGCSSGEEAYTLASVAYKHFGVRAREIVEIDATDIDTSCLERAGAGIYPIERVKAMMEEDRRLLFLKGSGANAGKVCARPELRSMIRFSQFNLVNGDWSTRPSYDLILCRNVMIYFEQKVQEELIGRFARVLNPRGYLMLGHSESLHRISTSFEAVGKTVFRLLEQDGHPAKMSKNPWKEESVPKVPIIAGQLIATRESTWLTTVLGSCVAVCIYDPKAQVGGMNHFVLPTGEGSEKNCYGIHAMANLIRKVQEMGGGLRTLRSKAFGGAQTGESIGDVGRQNIDFTREYLTDAGIPIIAEKLGGNQGMHIMFNPTTGQAFVKSC